MTASRPAERLCALFKGLDRAYGVRTKTGATDERGKVAARYQTERAELTPEIWEGHLRGDYGLVPIPIQDDSTVLFGAIDIDVYDDFDHAQLVAQIDKMGLPLVVCRTKSGGAHAYLFLSEPSPAKQVRDTLDSWAMALGYPGVEIFPKQVNLSSERDTGNGIAAPYMGGDDSLQYGIGPRGKALSLAEFLSMAEAARTTVDKLPEAEACIPDLDGAPPCLLRFATMGIPAGGRNDAMFDFGLFCRRKWPEQWQRKLEEMNQRFCSPPLPAGEIVALTKSVARRENYSYRAKCQGAYCSPGGCKRAKYGREDKSDATVDDPGAAIDGLTIVHTDPKTFIVSVDGHRVEMTSEAMLNQGKFRQAVLEQCSIWVPTLKAKVWAVLARNLVANAEHEDAPDDAGRKGILRQHLEDFFAERLSTDQAKLRLEHAWYDPEQEQYCFRVKDLLSHLKRHRIYGYTERDIYNFIRSIGGSDTRIRVDGEMLRVWVLPGAPPRDENPLPAPQSDDHEPF